VVLVDDSLVLMRTAARVGLSFPFQEASEHSQSSVVNVVNTHTRTRSTEREIIRVQQSTLLTVDEREEGAGGFIIKLNACTYVQTIESKLFSVALDLHAHMKMDIIYEERAHPSLSVDTVLLNKRGYIINRRQLHLKET